MKEIMMLIQGRQLRTFDVRYGGQPQVWTRIYRPKYGVLSTYPGRYTIIMQGPQRRDPS